MHYSFRLKSRLKNLCVLQHYIFRCNIDIRVYQDICGGIFSFLECFNNKILQ